MRGLATSLVFASAASLAAAWPNDWVNVNYVLKQAGSGGSSSTSASRQTIIDSASSSAKGGPWSVTDKGSVLPPSGNPHDYLSWAPYWWPNCNWCTKGTNHLANPSTDDGGDGDDDSDDSDDTNTGADPYTDTGDDDDDDSDLRRRNTAGAPHGHSTTFSAPAKRHVFGTHQRMRKWKEAVEAGAAQADGLDARQDVADGVTDGLPSVTVPTDSLLSTTQTTSSVGTMMGTPAPAEAPAKTQATKKSSSASCTPSPTKSLAPSATWTTCPYVNRDGKVNPDVRTLPDSPAAVKMPEAVLYNALTYALQKTASASQTAASFLDTFFLASKTAMAPNLNYGQMVRGPGADHQKGTFTGILDLRAMVKVVNAIQVLKAANSPDWTAARDQAMVTWVKAYLTWLQTSDLGKQVASKANNHVTFYYNQIAALQMYVGDTKGAVASLKSYFSNQFQDQVAASGEQPFEATRTRPYHYRCFNLEAMITNAKLGDQLGLNFWTAKSKYGATIQTALDYVMGLDPGSEDISDIFPHVASVAAAYGDPKGTYAAFLQKHDSDYKSEPFWFYDQTAALPNSPAASGKNKRAGADVDVVERRDAVDGVASAVGDTFGSFSLAQTIPFSCPSVFANATETELDDGVYVTCNQVRSYYEILPANMNVTVLVG